ncbi:hypothetical protein LV457_10620 [Mycobacterium sp. MYCO198283]|uniref:hypothetical protein n=1 Tax=Mycobacterium sp. MYCO198283 TaxID=2883505 RepID=UPI001E3A4D12|nr:hypothetical protein [Mycobacterium sp. MYCO198283]MCG5432740.1 hypothetical protein [Mycobacterium sp. MYCO198283]
MLIVALTMAVIGLAALVAAIVSGNEIIAWVCIAASVIGVVVLIIDAIRERQGADASPSDDDDATADGAGRGTGAESTYETFDAEYPTDAAEPGEATAVLPVAGDPPTEGVRTSGSPATGDDAASRRDPR